MDELLLLLNEVSTILIPIVGLICLVLLGVILFNLNKAVKKLSVSIDGVDKVVASTNLKIDQLEGPLNTLNSVSKTVDVVNDSAVRAVSNAVKFTVKHSDSFVNWGKEAIAKRKGHKEEVEEDVEKKEDFGIYE